RTSPGRRRWRMFGSDPPPPPRAGAGAPNHGGAGGGPGRAPPADLGQEHRCVKHAKPAAAKPFRDGQLKQPCLAEFLPQGAVVVVAWFAAAPRPAEHADGGLDHRKLVLTKAEVH